MEPLSIPNRKFALTVRLLFLKEQLSVETAENRSAQAMSAADVVHNFRPLLNSAQDVATNALKHLTMNTKTTLSWFAFLFGEAIIIASFFLWKGDTQNNIFVLNLIVSSIIYLLFFVDILIPWIKLNDKAHRQVGSIGLRWVISWGYAFLAICTMLICNLTFETPFELQLIIHCCLLLLLILGFVGVLHSSSKMVEIYEQESFNSQIINEIKHALTSLKNILLEYPDLPEPDIQRINNLEENIRYIAPSNNPEARTLEKQLLDIINDITIAIPNFKINKDSITASLKKAERVY